MNQKIIHVFSVIMKTFAIFISCIIHQIGIAWLSYSAGYKKGYKNGKKSQNRIITEKEIFSSDIKEIENQNTLEENEIIDKEKEVVLDL